MSLLRKILRKRKSLSGYLIVRNAVAQGYPFLKAINSVLASCQEFLVLDGYSTDETWEGLQLLKARHPQKVKLFGNTGKARRRGAKFWRP